MNLHHQGGGALIGVLLLLAMSAALLHATRRQLDASLRLVADERQFIRQYSQAESALAWGRRQDWSWQEPGWQCKTDLPYGWRACLNSVTAQRSLLSGDSGAGTLAHYQWLEADDKAKTRTPALHGWIDFCPLTPPERCNRDE
ncbi:DUF2509 family protein [Pantoea sp. FN060301]|uniref:DUF2509 family protein n=1 Tax=Pantoea sp. FN060301 TaxID=3420380 RepID=UPI003D16893B